MDIISNLILSNNLQFEEGEVKLLGTNVFLIPPEVYLYLFKELKTRNQDKIVYETSRTSSFDWISKLKESSGKRDIDDLLVFFPKILNLLAYGITTMTKKDIEGCKFTFTLDIPLFPELYGASEEPVDLAFAGLLAGGVSAILKKNIICKETACVSTGAKQCIFELSLGEN